jgi:tRNA modification GTPase
MIPSSLADGAALAANANRAIVLTPPGAAAIAVIRLCGPGVLPWLEKCFSKKVIEGRCVHGELVDGGAIIDDPVIVLVPGGTAADINLHGGVWVVQACMDLAQRHGFTRLSTQAPLPAEAVDAETEIEREMLAYLPQARTREALEALLAQPAAWESLNLDSMSSEQRSALLADRSLHWLLHPPRVAIVGLPNAGKSTLANQLFGTSCSITSDQPGTTRDWVGEQANLDGLMIELVDTPGIRAADDPIESRAIDRAARQIDAADAVVLVLDLQRMRDPQQTQLAGRFPDAITVVNKIDLSQKPAAIESASQFIQTAATIGRGIDELRGAIRARFGCEPSDRSSPRIWTARQRELIDAAAKNSA